MGGGCHILRASFSFFFFLSSAFEMTSKWSDNAEAVCLAGPEE